MSGRRMNGRRMNDRTDRHPPARGRLARACAVVVLLAAASITSGCQFLQNEFFYLCPTPKAQEGADTLDPTTEP